MTKKITLDLYQQLGVSREVAPEALFRLITEQSARWNQLVSSATTTRSKENAQWHLRVLAEARHTLLDPQRRAAYDAELEGSGLEMLPEAANESVQAAEAPVSNETVETLPNAFTEEYPADAPAGKPEDLAPEFRVDLNNLSSEDSLRIAVEAGEPVKACPYCRETIKAKARKCRHCGEFLPEDGGPTLSHDMKMPQDTVSTTLPEQHQSSQRTEPSFAPLQSGSTVSPAWLALMALIGSGGLVIGIAITKTETPPPRVEVRYEQVPVVVTASPEPPENSVPPPLTRDEFEVLMRNWQGIKQHAFANEDDSRLEEALTEKMLQETRDAINWVRDPAHSTSYPRINLIEMQVGSVYMVDPYKAKAEAIIEEERDMVVRGRCRRTHSRYNVSYTLRHNGAGWRLAEADTTPGTKTVVDCGSGD